MALELPPNITEEERARIEAEHEADLAHKNANSTFKPENITTHATA